MALRGTPLVNLHRTIAALCPSRLCASTLIAHAFYTTCPRLLHFHTHWCPHTSTAVPLALRGAPLVYLHQTILCPSRLYTFPDSMPTSSIPPAIPPHTVSHIDAPTLSQLRRWHLALRDCHHWLHHAEAAAWLRRGIQTGMDGVRNSNDEAFKQAGSASQGVYAW